MSACAPDAYVTVSMDLSAAQVPDSVATLSVFVVDPDEDEVVTSATVTRDRTSVELGVPAEIPLVFNVVAWTSLPGPASLPAMPSYVGAVERIIPLGRERQRVGVNVGRAGVLTLASEAFDDPDPERVRVALQPERPGARLLRFEMPRDNAGWRRTMVVPRGRLTATLEDADDEVRLFGGEGLYVADQRESVARLSVVEVATDDVETLAVALFGDTVQTSTDSDGVGPAVQPPVFSPATFGVDVQGLDPEQMTVDSSDARVRLVGAGRLDDVDIEQVGLPTRFEGLDATGTGWARLLIIVDFSGGRTLRSVLRFNIRPENEPAGAATSLALSRVEDDELARGTQLGVQLLDDRGLFSVGFSGEIDLSESDPWVFVPEGPNAVLVPADRGVLIRTLIRSSAPRALEVVLRATATSTAPATTLTATAALPLISLDL